MKSRQVHLGDGVEHEPREVLLRQLLTQARRQQQLLLTITRDEVLRHHRIVLSPPDDTRFVRHPPRGAAACKSGLHAIGRVVSEELLILFETMALARAEA